MSGDVDVSNSIGGKFKKGNNDEAVSKWEFEFAQNTTQASLNVYLNGVCAAAIGLTDSQLTANLSKKDINQLIQWLCVVKCQLPNGSS